MRTIFVNRYFYPDQSATSRMVSALAFGLARQGGEVAVVTSRDHHDRQDATLPARETCSGVDVVRLATSRFGRASLPGRALDYLSFHVTAFAWLARNVRRGDVVVVCTDPPLISLACALPVRLRGGEMVNWVMDLFPETAFELGLFKKIRLLGRLAARLRDRSVAGARLTICPTERMADYLKARGLPGERLRVLHHWADATEIHPVARDENRLRTAWGYDDTFVVGYSGNFGRAHEFSTLIDAATLLKDRPDIRFLLVGGGHKLQSVKAAAQERGLSNIAFKPLQPAEHRKPRRTRRACRFAAASPRALHHPEQVLRHSRRRPADALHRRPQGKRRRGCQRGGLRRDGEDRRGGKARRNDRRSRRLAGTRRRHGPEGKSRAGSGLCL
jgi:glycosyltransferase involved in cell wall biosynthesis